jgi:hypothetical protein
MVLGARGWWPFGEGSPEITDLHGRTSQGHAIRATLVDGKLNGFDTHVTVRCPEGESYDWRWYPSDGNPVPFHRNGSRFYVRERSDYPDRDPPIRLVSVMHGGLEDSGGIARGTIRSRELWRYRSGTVVCDGRASFSARERD